MRHTANHWNLDLQKPEHRLHLGHWLGQIRTAALDSPHCTPTILSKTAHAIHSLTVKHSPTYTTPQDIQHWLSVRELHILSSYIGPVTTWTADGDNITIVGIPDAPITHSPAWTSDELRDAITDDRPHIVLHDAHYYHLNPRGLAAELDNALLDL